MSRCVEARIPYGFSLGVVQVEPDYYMNHGNPMCDCKKEMVYIRTEVFDSSDGDDGDLAFIETLSEDQINYEKPDYSSSLESS